MRAYAVWPSIRHPRIAPDVGCPATAAWLRLTFEPDASRTNRVRPATWNALRARGMIAGPPSRIIVEAVRRAADKDAGAFRLALYSPTGQSLSKAACFLFEEGAEEPALVVKAMPEAVYASRLQHETEIVESIRRQLGGSPAAAALPLSPRFAGTAASDYVVVQPVDPLASRTGQVDDRKAAIGWLREFQEGTTRRIRAWDQADTAAAVDLVRYAWRRASPKNADVLVARAERHLRTLEGQAVSRCSVHGDFWRGNIAQANGRLRIYDWEWAESEGTPFFDLWTFELGILRRRAEEGEPNLVQPLRDALAFVSAELGRRGIEPSFALATLAPSLANLVFRVRRATGRAGGAEAESVRLLKAAEELLP